MRRVPQCGEPGYERCPECAARRTEPHLTDCPLRPRLRDRGASAVEYGLMIAAIAAVIVGVVFGLGTLVQSAFSKTCSTIASGDKLDGGQCSGSPAPVTQ